MSEPTINGMTFTRLANHLATNYDQRTERMAMESRILDALHDVRAKTIDEITKMIEAKGKEPTRNFDNPFTTVAGWLKRIFN